MISRVREHGGRPAIRLDDRTFSYADLLDASDRVASALLGDAGDLSEARIAFLLPAGPRYVAAQWGIWRAGGVVVPISQHATDVEIEYLLRDTGAACVICLEEKRARFEGLAARVISVEETDSFPSVDLPTVDPSRRAMILYTSGTTSRPKGVVTTHETLQSQIESLHHAWGWRADDRIPLFLPLHHVHGIVNILCCGMWAGAEVDAYPRFDAATILPKIAAGNYSVFMAVPTIYARLVPLLEGAWGTEDERKEVLAGFARLRLMVSGSAALPPSLFQKWKDLTGQVLLERYGMTEIGMALSNPLDGERRCGAVGRPLPGVEVRLRADDGSVVGEESIPGEIQVRGRTVFSEYWGKEEATREAFDDGWFCTGDMAVLENGYYRILGRMSVDIIKSGGYKLSALEIEAALIEHPDIQECAVVGVMDEVWGETVALAAVARPGLDRLDLADLNQWASSRLSAYKLPRKLRCLKALPRNAMGKVSKKDLPALFA